MGLWEKIKGFFNKQDLTYYNDDVIEVMYLNAGALFGELIYDRWPDDRGDLCDMLDAWQKWEKEYAARGYKTLSLDAFIAIGALDQHPVTAFGLGRLRVSGEATVLHAPHFREHYVKQRRSVPRHELLGERSCWDDLPSTAHLDQYLN